MTGNSVSSLFMSLYFKNKNKKPFQKNILLYEEVSFQFSVSVTEICLNVTKLLLKAILMKLMIFKSMGSLFKGLNEPTLGFGLINISFKCFSLVDALFVSLNILCKVDISRVPVSSYIFL